MALATQKKLDFSGKVMQVFSEVQKSPAVHKTHIFSLVRFSQQDYSLFMYSFEQAYLKIFQSFHTKTNKKIPGKFQSLAQLFFETLLTKKFEEEINSPQNKKTLEVFNSFLALCSEGIYSTIMNIRVMCCRLVFLLIKQIPPKKMQNYLKQEVQEALVNSTLHVLRTKVSTYRQLGIKLASLILHFNSLKCENIQKQMFKILAVEDNQQIRKLVITNLSISKNNLEDVLIRLRDKNPQIRSIVAKKLQGEKFKLQDMTISNLYKLLYDGYGSKQLTVKQECLRYFSMFFLQQDSNAMIDQRTNKHKQFVKMFRPDILLLNPHLYHLFDELISELLAELEASMKQYIRQSCLSLKTGNLAYQVIWLKNSVNSKSKEITKVYEQYGPTGLDLSKVLILHNNKNQAFAIFEILQLFGRQKMPDQVGRNSMFNALKSLLVDLKYFEIKPDYTNFKDTDICHILTKQQIHRKKLMLSYYDIPIISNSLDLIFQIGEAMKSLRPNHYENEMKQSMSEWHNPDQNTHLKQRQLILKNIKQIQTQKNKDKNLLPRFYQKLKHIQQTIQQQSQKTRKVIVCICRLRYNCDLEIFMPIIKQQLDKKDKSNGLLLLGLYCLESAQKVSNFWSVFWQYISTENGDENNKNHLLVSLKVVIDFIVKFNCLSGPFNPLNLQDFNADMFMDQMIKLMLHEDADVRILSIQSLCRLLYHERVDKNNQGTYFLILILLWLQTSTQIVSAKSVHTVSIFIKSYIEKGNSYSLKLSYIFCLFFKVIVQFNNEKKGINKQLIKYNLTIDQFIKKTLFTVMTIFKYQKQSKNVIWTYNPQQSQIGPQQFILLYLIKDDYLISSLGRALLQCDFFEFCGLQTLIMVKRVLQPINESKKWKSGVEQSLKKLQEDIERQISLKNSQTFYGHILQGLEQQNEQKMKLLSQQGRYIHKNIQDKGLFTKIQQYSSGDSDSSSQSQKSSSSESNGQEENQQKNEDKMGQSENIEQIIKKRQKAPIISISQQQKQQENQQNQGEESEQKSENKQKKNNKALKNKKQLPIAPLRNLRKRK